jgi:heptosyltransferase III
VSPIDQVVIYRLGSLGDTVVALPCFHLIERAFPAAKRLVLTNVPVSNKAPPLEAILKDGGFIHGSIRYPRGVRNVVALARLASELRRQRASTLVYLAASKGLAATRRDVAYFRLCGFRRIIGAPLSADLRANRVDDRGELERESHRLARTLAELGTIDFDDRTWWDLRLTEAERARGEAALGPLATQPFIAANTGGKVAENDWGQANWLSLLDELGADLSGYGLVFVGARDDRERAGELGARWRGRPVVNLCGQLRPRESAAALARADLFVGHDSGPLHLADAVGTSALGLFGGYNRPKVWHPSGVGTCVIHRMEGLASIKPVEVADLARQLLSEAAVGQSSQSPASPQAPWRGATRRSP